MTKHIAKLRAEFSAGSWEFVDPAPHGKRVRFDQAIMDATHLGEGFVVGYVKAVHGIDMDIVQWMNNQQREVMGITNSPRFGISAFDRVRLLEGGVVERVATCGG